MMSTATAEAVRQATSAVATPAAPTGLTAVAGRQGDGSIFGVRIMNNVPHYDNGTAPYKDDPKSFRRKLDNQLAPHNVSKLDTCKLLDQLLKKRPKGVYDRLQKEHEGEERLGPMTEAAGCRSLIGAMGILSAALPGTTGNSPS